MSDRSYLGRASVVWMLAQVLSLSACAASSATPVPATPADPEPPPKPVAVMDVRVTLTADNKYALYKGGLAGDHLEFLGRNEVGPVNDWQSAEEYPISPKPGDYLFVLAWDWGGPQSLIAQLAFADGALQVSNRSDWLCAVADIENPGASGPVPALESVSAAIHAAEWKPPSESAPNGASPWESIATISPSAEFIWPDGFASDVGSDTKVALCRPKNALDAATAAKQ